MYSLLGLQIASLNQNSFVGHCRTCEGGSLACSKCLPTIGSRQSEQGQARINFVKIDTGKYEVLFTDSVRLVEKFVDYDRPPKGISFSLGHSYVCFARQVHFDPMARLKID